MTIETFEKTALYITLKLIGATEHFLQYENDLSTLNL